ncbi:MAG TPA: fasciclin domain-containing protein [Dongiaceae bacterium]|nr:fasciclin domain-containing protein [Dongiaceae bacterium]
MRKSLLKVAGVSAIGLGLVVGVVSMCGAMTVDLDMQRQARVEQPAIVPVSDAALGSGGIQTWVRITELDGRGEGERPAQTLFVPSDAAFASLPPEELQQLLSPEYPDKRRALIARAATDTRLTPNDIAGKRISVTTQDGRLLVIDATGEEVLVGDAEALDVRTLPDGRVLFVLDHLPQ